MKTEGTDRCRTPEGQDRCMVFLYRNGRFLEQFWAPVPLSCSRPFAAKQKNPQLTQRRKHKPKPSLWRARERHVGRRVANEDVQPVVVADANGICDDAEDGRRSERRTSAAAVRESLCLQELETAEQLQWTARLPTLPAERPLGSRERPSGSRERSCKSSL